MSPAYPVMLDLMERRAVVVGGGRVALRRAAGLIDAGAVVEVIAPEVTPDLAALDVSVHLRRYRDGDLNGAWMVHAVTGDPQVNAAVAAEAERHRVWCVRADDPAVSAAWTPAVTRHGDITVAVTSGGDPIRSQRLRSAIAASLADGRLPIRPHRRPRPASPAAGSSSAGPAVRALDGAAAAGGSQADRTQPDAAAPDDTAANGIQLLDAAAAPSRTQADRTQADDTRPDDTAADGRQADADVGGRPRALAAAGPVPDENAPPAGWVALVGGGPGDPELLTVRGRRLLAEADVVVADQLAPRDVLAELDPDVEIIDAGKRPGAHTLTQDQINEILVRRAQAGQRVVRLKGGDPFVFGRGGEEALACARAGVPVAVVPGVTSAVAVPASAGIPVTHRGVTQDFAVVSAHLDPSHPGATVDWAALAAGPGTLVLLMAVGQLELISRELVKRGRDAATPVAVITEGTTPRQRVLTSTLGQVAGEAARAQLRPPGVVVIGEVVRLRDQLGAA